MRLRRDVIVRSLGVAMLMLLSASPVAVRAASLHLTNALDANCNDANIDGVWDTLSPGPTVSLLAYNGGSSYNYRAGVEFDIRMLEIPLPFPQQVRIDSATLLMHYEGASGSEALTLQFSKFDGDGQLTLSDFQLRDPIGPRFNAFSPASDGLYRVPAKEFVQSLVDRKVPFAGFFAENLAQNQTSLGGYYSLVPPALDITYTIVPEPASATLAGAAMAAGLLRRRARRA